MIQIKGRRSTRFVDFFYTFFFTPEGKNDMLQPQIYLNAVNNIGVHELMCI